MTGRGPGSFQLRFERVRKWCGRVVGTPAGALAVGLGLLTVPALFDIFPSLQGWPWGVRLGLLGVLVAIGGLAASSAFERERNLQRLTERQALQREQARVVALHLILENLLRPQQPILRGHEPTVYQYSGERLVALWPPPSSELFDTDDPRIFEVGKGASGRAFASGNVFLVFGDDVANARHELSESQQRFFAGFRTVVSLPIFDDAGVDKIGCLSLLKMQEDRIFQTGAVELLALRKLVDVLGAVLTAFAVESVTPEE